MNAVLSPEPVAKKPAQNPPDPEPRERFDLRLDPALRARLERQARRFGVSLSAYIRSGMVEKLEADEATDPDRND